MTFLMAGLLLIPALFVLFAYIVFLAQLGTKSLIIGILLIPIGIGGLWLNNFINSKKIVERHDIIGSYVIDRSKYSGKQADWQYNHYRFQILDNGNVEFYQTNGEKILMTYKGIFHTIQQTSARLFLNMNDKNFHVTKENPTLYRLNWSFYYVFYSEKYNNMFFKKGTWKPIN